MFNRKGNDKEQVELKEILDKLLELEKEKQKTSPVKITICLVGGFGSVMFILLLCYSAFKSGFSFSLESILSTLLAFFSIFISIFFYFKADETSTNFYDSSYKFMKDISVTLGKIEERFGEKLNSLNDKVSHLDRISNETSEEIEDKKYDRYNLLNELMDKANLGYEERNRYKKELEEKDAEIERLKIHKSEAEYEARQLRYQMNQLNDINVNVEIPSRGVLIRLLKDHNTSNMSIKTIYKLKKMGIIDEDGNINENIIIDMLKSNYRG